MLPDPSSGAGRAKPEQQVVGNLKIGRFHLPAAFVEPAQPLKQRKGEEPGTIPNLVPKGEGSGSDVREATRRTPGFVPSICSPDVHFKKLPSQL